jgi:cellulose synthase/poly-beta-1,6-N-acetylglucosamine synthase-like glycosyltransferase
MVRHFIFTINRSFSHQKMSYEDILDSELPSISILIPMHNEEHVASQILDKLIKDDYKGMEIEIIAINDQSEDKTADILKAYEAICPNLRVIHRTEGIRGKPAALNEGLKIAKGEVVLVFDADYLPPKGMIRNLAISFKDPEISSVMGRVVPLNEAKNLLTRLIGMERASGYQVDQQARYNMDLLPQYGGTVGGFRKDLIMKIGGFDPTILAEDTNLTFITGSNGWKIQYANSAECYEEVPEEWAARARQIQRWSRGHNQVLFNEFTTVLSSPYFSFIQKVDALLLLFIYTIPTLLLVAMVSSIILFFLGELHFFLITQFAVFMMAYYGFGNFAPFYQICVASILDGDTKKVRLIPFMAFKFIFSMFYSTKGFIQAVVDYCSSRIVTWEKTSRFRQSP